MSLDLDLRVTHVHQTGNNYQIDHVEIAPAYHIHELEQYVSYVYTQKYNCRDTVDNHQKRLTHPAGHKNKQDQQHRVNVRVHVRGRYIIAERYGPGVVGTGYHVWVETGLSDILMFTKAHNEWPISRLLRHLVLPGESEMEWVVGRGGRDLALNNSSLFIRALRYGTGFRESLKEKKFERDRERAGKSFEEIEPPTPSSLRAKQDETDTFFLVTIALGIFVCSYCEQHIICDQESLWIVLVRSGSRGSGVLGEIYRGVFLKPANSSWTRRTITDNRPADSERASAPPPPPPHNRAMVSSSAQAQNLELDPDKQVLPLFHVSVMNIPPDVCYKRLNMAFNSWTTLILYECSLKAENNILAKVPRDKSKDTSCCRAERCGLRRNEALTASTCPGLMIVAELDGIMGYTSFHDVTFTNTQGYRLPPTTLTVNGDGRISISTRAWVSCKMGLPPPPEQLMSLMTTTATTPDQYSCLDLPVIVNLVYCERNALSHVATEAGSEKVEFRGSEPGFAWRKSGKPSSSPKRDSNLDLPVVSSLAQLKTSALANYATEAGLHIWTRELCKLIDCSDDVQAVVVLALAVVAYAEEKKEVKTTPAVEEKKTEKRGLLGLGYGAAPSIGYAAPAVGYASHGVGLTAPAVGYASHGIGLAGPAVSYASHGVGLAAPAVGYASHGIGYAAPAVGYASHSIGLTGPAVSYASPSIGYAAPSVSYAAPAVSYASHSLAAPAVSYAAPSLSYAAPALSYAAPSIAKVGYAATPAVAAAPALSYAAPAYGYASAAPAYGYASASPAYGYASAAPAYASYAAPALSYAAPAITKVHAAPALAYGSSALSYGSSAYGYGYAAGAPAYASYASPAYGYAAAPAFAKIH
uniref:Uncharacterized protein n=1 Tax=Timema tahoe TaxID=61484 RepID=A0A7R9NU35_9NEOP|nr:unnamed protein product [Timema tahoe]